MSYDAATNQVWYYWISEDDYARLAAYGGDLLDNFHFKSDLPEYRTGYFADPEDIDPAEWNWLDLNCSLQQIYFNLSSQPSSITSP